MARGVRLPSEAWTRRDWALVQAVDLLDANRCPGCGQPMWLSHDKAFRRRWKVSAERCFACTAVDQRQEQFSDAPQSRSIYFGAQLMD